MGQYSSMDAGRLEGLQKYLNRERNAGQDKGEKGDGTPPRPWLVIPYYDADDGGRANGTNRRTFPGSVVSYLCDHIKVNGQIYDGTPLTIGQTLNITVDVANWGDKPAAAQVSLYWTDPTAVFTNLHVEGIGDPVQVAVPSAGVVTSDVITFTPQGTLDHVCLIAVVTATEDPEPGTYDVSDRHYAQHNLNLVAVQAGKMGTFQFVMGNPFDSEATVTVRLRPASEEELGALKQLYHFEPVDLSADCFRFQMVGQDAEDRLNDDLVFQLGPGERQLCLGFVLDAGLQPGQFAAAEIEQLVSSKGERGERERRGSLGIVVFPEEARGRGR